MAYINPANNSSVKNTDTKKNPIKKFNDLLNGIGITGEIKDGVLVRLNNLARQSGLKEMDLNILISRRGLDTELIAIEGEDGIEIKRADPRIRFEGKDFGIKAELHIWLRAIDQIKNPHEKTDIIRQMIKYFDRKKYGLLITYSEKDEIAKVYPLKEHPINGLEKFLEEFKSLLGSKNFVSDGLDKASISEGLVRLLKEMGLSKGFGKKEFQINGSEERLEKAESLSSKEDVSQSDEASLSEGLARRLDDTLNVMMKLPPMY